MPISRTARCNNGRNALNHQIPSLMAIAIIDGFKMIDVDHQTAQRSMGMDRQRHLRMQRFVKDDGGYAGRSGGIEQRFFQQGAAQTLIGQRQAQRFRHQLEIGREGASPAVTFWKVSRPMASPGR